MATLGAVILDLDEGCTDALIEAVLEIESPERYLAEFDAARRRPSFSEDKFLHASFSKHFRVTYYAVSAVGEEPARREISKSVVRDMISVRFVFAQNKLDDSGADRTLNLSRSFEAYYRAHSQDEAKDENVEGLDLALIEASKQLDQNFAGLFEPIFEDLRTFGIDRAAPVQIPRVVTQMQADAVLRGSTRIEYPLEVGATALPEGHHGLGYSKLIFTILQIVGFYEGYRRATPRPALQLLFIEEPEAHLHPQMQEVFIENIRGFLGAKAGWNVQLLITSHSPHIMTKSGFECVRYFDRGPSGVQVRDLLTFQNKLETAPDGQETLRFLKQYIELRPCDMFFADKIILVEGTVERLLLPVMIKKCAPQLTCQYISIIEVGGAYAVKFRELLSFLGVPALVITDIDSGTSEGRHPACEPLQAGAVTTNSTLKNWLPGKNHIDALLATDDQSKTDGHVRVAYQVPEVGDNRVGRSFEDAFILSNVELLAEHVEDLVTQSAFIAAGNLASGNSGEAIARDAYAIAERLQKHRTTFAFDILRLEGWSVPRYIEEGLKWL